MSQDPFSKRCDRRSGAALAFACAIALNLCACGDDGTNGGGQQIGNGGPRQAASRGLYEIPPTTCTGTSPHVKHLNEGLTCGVCHPCGGVLGIASITIGSRNTAGATVQGSTDTSPASCVVACHYPPGGTPTTVTWVPQTLACTSCHGNVIPPGTTVRSYHPGLGSSSGTVTCTTCHDTSQHLSGTPRFVGGESNINNICQNCHSGTGGTLSGETPPLLVGWTDPDGDFHGSRTGTGFGGTLLSPWVRGQDPLPCIACHDAHASSNAFLFAQTVNGSALPQGTIDRAGVGAHKLCESCHAGERHAYCEQCHVTDPMPAGAPCLSCHGHEGIRFFIWPSGTPDNYHGNNSGDCRHCHDNWMPVLEYTAPVLLNGPVATSITPSGATIAWTTDEQSTSYVEYGTTDRGWVEGSTTMTTQHAVTLSGLSSTTGYNFRIRSSDPMRNFTLSPTVTFSTTCPTCIAAPSPNPIDPVWTYASSFSLALTWGATTCPDGDPVQYRVMLALDPGYASPYADSGWITAQTYTVNLPTGNAYYWQVKARDAVHLNESDWSATSTFWSAVPDPGY